MKRSGFTLIELMISITILSIMMIFLYQSYASLNRSNAFYKKEVHKILDKDVIKKIIYLDIALSLHKSIVILNQEKDEDVVFFQTSNSLHKNYNPYVAYVKKDAKLYRLESFHKFKEYPLSVQDQFSVDYMGEIESFRLYKSNKKINDKVVDVYLSHIDFKEGNDILLKIKALNEY
jgi:prepilin-type N-terminal cleavage/methylation domain-containing protein